MEHSLLVKKGTKEVVEDILTRSIGQRWHGSFTGGYEVNQEDLWNIDDQLFKEYFTLSWSHNIGKVSPY